MTEARAAWAGAEVEPLPGAPPAEITVAPATIDQLAGVLDQASDQRRPMLVWGGGTRQGLGSRVDAEVVLSTHRLDRVVDWQPDDLTLVVEAGARVERVEDVLAERGQSAILPERAGDGTVGGAVATGASCWRRLRYGPIRDRMLEVDLVTGDGRVVRAGGRVVKNVTGYDLPRLVTGSLGGLGVIARVCLKLWPLGSSTATVTMEEPDRALATAYRPLAVIRQRQTTQVMLAGSGPELESQVAALGGVATPGLDWPEPPPGPVRWTLGVAASEVRSALERIPSGWAYQAALGVGEIRLGAPADSGGDALELRAWAESRGGHVVLADGPPELYRAVDPWGRPPPGLGLQRRLVARFDPCRVVNPGRLPGGI